MREYIEKIKSLGSTTVADLVLKHGPGILREIHAHSIKRQEGKAWKQHELTAKEIQEAVPEFLNSIQPREIGVVPQAFNSTPAFVHYFQTAAIGAMPLVLLDISAAVKRVGRSLEGIRDELRISSVARVQGWDVDGFGGHVHEFVRNEMNKGSADGQHHFFYVWHPDDDWYPAFERRQRAAPLGPQFGGYHHDLPTICLRMRTDREALITTTDNGHDAVLHLLIPAYYPLVIDQPIAFADRLLPLIITAQRHRIADFVWFELRQNQERLRLENVSILPFKTDLAKRGSLIAFNGGVCAAMAGAAAALIFPPCSPIIFGLVMPAADILAYGSAATVAAASIYDNMTAGTVQVLGDPVFIS